MLLLRLLLGWIVMLRVVRSLNARLRVSDCFVLRACRRCLLLCRRRGQLQGRERVRDRMLLSLSRKFFSLDVVDKMSAGM